MMLTRVASWVAGFAAVALLLLVAPAAHAVTLVVTPSSQDAGVGTSVSVDVLVSGLVAGAPPSLGGFDLDIAFDPSILVLIGASLNAPLGGNAQFDFEVQGTASGAVVNLFALSSLSDPELEALQGDEFTIATLIFNTLAPGTSPLTLGNIVLTNGAGGSLPLQVAFNGEIVVPEPGTAIAVGLGLAALALVRRRARR
ncbi:MAG: cohesin domain-containing protein [bacterium]